MPDLTIRVRGGAGGDRVGHKMGLVSLGWPGAPPSAAPARLAPCGDANSFSFIKLWIDFVWHPRLVPRGWPGAPARLAPCDVTSTSPTHSDVHAVVTSGYKNSTLKPLMASEYPIKNWRQILPFIPVLRPMRMSNSVVNIFPWRPNPRHIRIPNKKLGSNFDLLTRFWGQCGCQYWFHIFLPEAPSLEVSEYAIKFWGHILTLRPCPGVTGWVNVTSKCC